MKNLCVSLFIICTLCICGLGQPRSELLATFDQNYEDVLNGIDDAALEAKARIEESGGKLVIRVCSKESFPIALALAKGLPFVAKDEFENYGGNSDRLIYLRNADGCKIISNDYFVTEFWYAPEDVELPAFIEARRATALTAVHLIARGNTGDGQTLAPVTAESFVGVLEKAVNELKENRTAIMLIVTPSDKLVSGTAQVRRAKQARDYLVKNGIAEHRIQMRKAPADRPVPEFPNIMILKDNYGTCA
jgi:hypothetical protein